MNTRCAVHLPAPSPPRLAPLATHPPRLGRLPRQLLTHLFHTATETLRDAFRTRLDLPDGKLGAIAAVHTFGDYLIFHPHLHVLAANGLFTPDGHFHCMPAEDLDPAQGPANGPLLRHLLQQNPRPAIPHSRPHHSDF